MLATVVAVAVDVFLKSFIIVSTHRRRHVASETVFKQDSTNPNPDSDSLMECIYPNPDSLIEHPLSLLFCVRSVRVDGGPEKVPPRLKSS